MPEHTLHNRGIWLVLAPELAPNEYGNSASSIYQRYLMDNSKKPVPYEALMLANAISINAPMNVLECKGILTREEVVAEVDALKKQMNDEARKN